MSTILSNGRPYEASYQEMPMTNGNKKIRLFLAEEQQLLREAFQSFFSSHPVVEVVGVTGDTSGESLIGAALSLNASTMLVGIKTLQPSTVEQLEMVREACPDVGIVLLSASYDMRGIKSLRQFSRGLTVGCAYLLKHTIDTVDQLTQVIASVHEGRIILDPAVMEGLITAGETSSVFLKELSPREMEVLSWMAKGYRNNTIAEVLCLEPKTVERHINSIYSKLGNSGDSRHPRVYAITLFLKAAGLLTGEHFIEA